MPRRPTTHDPFNAIAEPRRRRLLEVLGTRELPVNDIVEQVGGYRPEFTVTEDTDLWNRIAEAGHSVLVQPETLMQVRIHESSLTRSSLLHQARQFRWLESGARRRRSGDPEVSFEAFLENERRANPLRRMNTLRQDYGQVFYKRAAIARTNRSVPAMLAMLGAATLLFPSHALSNVWRKAFRAPARALAADKNTRDAPIDRNKTDCCQNDEAA